MTAGGADVSPAALPDYGSDPGFLQDILKCEDFLLRGPVVFRFRVRVERDEVHLAPDTPDEGDQASRVGRGIVQAVEEDVFEGDAFPRGDGIVPAGLNEAGQRIFPVDGHDLASERIVRGVEAYGQVHGAVLAQAGELGDKARGWTE